MPLWREVHALGYEQDLPQDYQPPHVTTIDCQRQVCARPHHAHCWGDYAGSILFLAITNANSIQLFMMVLDN